MLFPYLSYLRQHILPALVAAPLARLMLTIGLPAKAKYSADSSQAKVRTAHSQKLESIKKCGAPLQFS
ncbi:MAG TPA: hypothetical protein VF598_06850 [Hymenobacter sp.]